MPEPIRLYISIPHENPAAFACGKCRVVCPSEEDATAHCACRRCGAIIEPLPRLGRGRICATCHPIEAQESATERQRLAAEQDAASFAKAKKVPASEWTGPVVWDCGSGDMSGDGYYSGTEAVEDECAQGGRELPEYVWGTEEESMSLDAGDIIQRALEDAYDGAADQISAEAQAELQALLDGWCERHKVTWYSEDRSVAVIMATPDKDIESPQAGEGSEG